MHLTLIFIVIISYSTAYSHPLLANDNQWKPQQHELESRRNDELNSTTSRPVQQFFKKILSAFRVGSRTTASLPATSTQRTSTSQPSVYLQQPDLQEIPNFVDYSTYLLDSFMNSNSAIKFSYLEPNITNLRGGNYSVISFLVPQTLREKIPEKGFFTQFLDLFRFPWTRQPGAPPPDSSTVYSNFPPFLETFAQQIQAYYSIYKYTDQSRLNNTIVLTMPDIDNDDLYQQPLSDDIIETTTDYLMEVNELDENGNELPTTTELSL